MTNEGHIENLKAIASDMPSDKCADWIESLMAGVKALEQEPCVDAISRQAVLEAIDVKAWEFCDYLVRNGRNDEQKPVSHFADNLRECVGEDLPSVTSQPKMGKWIYDKKEDSYKCSLCGFPCHKDNLGAIPTKYCAGCGAVMEV